MDYEDDHHDEDGPRYRQPEAIGQSELRDGLLSLTLFGSDTNMRQQAFNLGLVDSFIMQLETQLLRKYLNEESYIEEAAAMHQCAYNRVDLSSIDLARFFVVDRLSNCRGSGADS